ncbi:MAG: glutamate--tRNA ligase [Candidatus Dojkabacteria bacterium]|nr:glutamate--tRNA ligase [Candidatus Dojkabacteria bacterium]
MSVRTRVAPSPTGYPHIGLIRTGLYCYALSKKNGGQFVLRLEDTDRSRFVEGATDEIYESFELYGLDIDESTKHGGDYGPYIQSERLDMYSEYAHLLVEKGAAYYCFLTPEETKNLQEQFRLENTRFRSPYRDMSLSESKQKVVSGESYVIRLKVPLDREITYEDGVQGKMKLNTNETSDVVLMKQDGFPTYHMAVAIDDHFMRISHVFRGFEWIPSIPVQILTYEALEWEMPKHYHLSVILNPDGKGKLSKRKGTTNAVKFIEDGYLPNAMLNFLMLLGWSSPLKVEHGEKEREIFSLEEFVELFDPNDLNKSNQRFDINKLNWFNKQYMNSTEIEEFKSIFITWLEKFRSDDELYNSVINDTKIGRKTRDSEGKSIYSSRGT